MGRRVCVSYRNVQMYKCTNVHVQVHHTYASYVYMYMIHDTYASYMSLPCLRLRLWFPTPRLFSFILLDHPDQAPSRAQHSTGITVKLALALNLHWHETLHSTFSHRMNPSTHQRIKRVRHAFFLFHCKSLRAILPFSRFTGSPFYLQQKIEG